jgi:hypothetical protein
MTLVHSFKDNSCSLRKTALTVTLDFKKNGYWNNYLNMPVSLWAISIVIFFE